MKILAIRGKNLASLSNKFEVDFQSEPLASAGIFAITGPTGAGKSTLLDALCLALYERTPRLARATARTENVPDVGDNGIAQSDPRTILRRGATEGFAEVDFVGSDGIAYRSRWMIRRARNKADGKLRNSEVSLHRLCDLQVLGDHRKTETLKLIEEKIGLNFEQFTRAVLLAQNDFATFLKASDDERAELLQTLTGSETFAKISKQAFTRMRWENEQLDRIREQLKGVAPLAPDARAEKETKLKQSREQQKTLQTAQALTEAHLRWHEQLAKFKGAETLANKALDTATAARMAAEPRYQNLTRIEQVQPARPLFAERERITQEIATTEKTLEERQKECLAAQQRTETRQSEAELAAKQLAQAEEAKTTAKPRVDSAKALDAKIMALTPQFQVAVKARDDAAKHHLDSTTTCNETKQTLQQRETARETGARWLSERADQKTLAEGWQRWETLFAQAIVQQNEHTKISGQIVALKKSDGNISRSLRKTQTEYTAHVTAHAAAQETLAKQTTAWKSFDVDAMAKRKQQLDVRREQLTTGERLWTTLVELQLGHRQMEAQQQTLTATVAQCETALATFAQQKPALERECSLAESTYNLAQLAASERAESMRSLLQPDAPCPVCGGLEHPYVTHSPQADALLKALSDRLEERRKALASVLENNVARTTERDGAQKQRVQLEKDLTASKRKVTEQQECWATLPICAEVTAIEESTRPDWFAEQLATVKTALERQDQEEKRYREATRNKDLAQDALNQAQKTLETTKTALNNLETEQKTIQQALESAMQRCGELEKQRDETLVTLDGAFANTLWRNDWQVDPEAFVVGCQRKAEAWLAQQKQLTECTNQISALKMAVGTQTEVCTKAEADLKKATAQLEEQNVELKSFQRELHGIFDGKAIKDIEAGLEHSIEEAKVKQAHSKNALDKAQAERTRWDEALRQTQELLAKHQQDYSTAKQRFEIWLSEFNAKASDVPLTELTLKSLLGFDSDWIEQERNALQRLNQGVESAVAVQKVQKAASETHEKTKPTEESEEVLAIALAKAKTELTTVAEAIANVQAELVGDDDRLKQSQALLEIIVKQEKTTRIWSQLGELIGSADGKKFRNFAQQLTLDILLGYGNRHLESLSHRYRLERIKDSLGLLVVDQDMGDEVRSVHSLSGGESFLVSLALALGLASLSSHRVKVESLFIDEGFGSLDNESLRVAMDALDNLQAQGRKVGVISHVQEMTERIGTRIQVNRQAGGESRISFA